MKECRRCGAKNATRAQFCGQCGAEFRVTDGASAPVNLEKTPEAPIERVDVRPAGEEKLGEATSAFLNVLFANLAGIVVAFGRWLWRLARPVLRAAYEFLRVRVAYMFSPAALWDIQRVPNFVYLAVLGALLWRLPTSVVAIVYAVLANDARAREDFELARARAELAKNWLLADFVVGVVVCVFRNLVR